MSFLATQAYTIPSLKNTESVRAEHFHFHLNFKNCSAVFDLEAKYNGVRCNGGKMWHSFFYLIILLSPEEVATECKEVAADRDNTNTDNDDDANANDTVMLPPKAKPAYVAAPRKPAVKKMTRESNEVIAMPPPPTPKPKPLVKFLVDSMDKFHVSYYCKGTQDYTGASSGNALALPQSSSTTNVGQIDFFGAFSQSSHPTSVRQ